MARNPEGWKLGKRKPYHVRFTHQGRRFDISTKSRDPREAAERAARIYADAVSGRLAQSGIRVAHPGTPLAELCTMWIDAIQPELGEKTGVTYTVYSGHWIRHFVTIGGVTTPAIGDYQRKRLGSVQRTTVVKERSALLRFLRWCEERGHVRDIPSFPALPRKAVGTKHKQGRSKPKTILTPYEVSDVLSALAGQARCFYVALYETGLRPVSTLRRLRREDLTPFGLHIRPEADKNRWERTVPLTPAARAALEAGLPFTEDHREAFRRACERALGRRETGYTLKHSRVTHWRDAGMSDNAIRFLTGTVSAIGAYNRPTRTEAERGLALWCDSGAEMKTECEGGDLNPYGSYPASTSSKSGPHKPQEKVGTRGAPEGASEQHSGALHQNLPAQVRIALWERSRGAA